MNVEVNYLAIIFAGVFSMAIGFLWYSKMLFGKPWMKLSGYTEEGIKKAQKEMGKLYALSFVATLVSAYVLSHVIVLSENFYDYSRLATGISSAFWMWFGFIMPVQLTGEIFGSKKWTLFAINTGYQLTAILAMGFVIAVL
ncbi:MAG: hypothetical protein ACD_50C00112G0005 [uncultured bacterium]|nr:MAG: hypothetical protein ACD_50C00112G0005 [uncultured bacterium]OGH13148.1 MAG: hypothetical protein A2687_05160 [Candidatus Levybacteria bacterium RIFCSPHIGHO2_01_FULL_38_26]